MRIKMAGSSLAQVFLVSEEHVSYDMEVVHQERTLVEVDIPVSVYYSADDLTSIVTASTHTRFGARHR
jgi:hypothetical protein